ncbi:uncharacterized protein [Nicotiana sylvestris]|uniref:uncharacterized protein n=1 Tax=Nicotiana sylvestris TaxID=4096 RepID=UPI00388CAD27
MREPQLIYSRKLIHTWKGYDVDLLSFIDMFNIIDLFAVEDNELSVDDQNIVHHTESYLVVDEAASDCSSNSSNSNSEDDTNDSDCNSKDASGYDSDRLEAIAKERKRVVADRLVEYKDIDKSMIFKDIPEARKFMNLYALANDYDLTLVKSDTIRVRYVCEDDERPYVCLISKDKRNIGVKIKTLKAKHEYNHAFDNHRVDATIIAHYFKKKLQESPKYKIKEMKTDLKITFNINASFQSAREPKE